MENKLKELTTAPAVHSAHMAVKHALKLKSFMQEKIAGGQLQSQVNHQLRMEKIENDKKIKEERNTKELKSSQKVAKDNKEKTTSGLVGLLGKSI